MFLVLFLVKISRNENEQGKIVRILWKPIIHQRHTAVVAMPRNYDNNADCRQNFKSKINVSVIAEPFVFSCDTVLFKCRFTACFVLSHNSLSSVFVAI